MKNSIPFRLSISLFTSLIWAFYIFPSTRVFQERQNDNYTGYIVDSLIIKPHNIDDFIFLSRNLDTVKLKTDGHPIIIETWNESCLPCLKSIRNLQEEFNSHKEYVTHFLLYENTKYPENLDIPYLSTKSIVNNNNNLLFDLNFHYYKDLKIQLYPVFVFYNKDGQYVTNMVGYSEQKHEIFIDKLRKNISLITEIN